MDGVMDEGIEVLEEIKKLLTDFMKAAGYGDDMIRALLHGTGSVARGTSNLAGRAKDRLRNSSNVAADSREAALNAVNNACEDVAKEGLVPPVDFVPGKKGNTIFEFKTVPWDSSASVLCNGLDKLGIPYKREVLTSPARLENGKAKYGLTKFEIDPMHKVYTSELADTISQTVKDFDRSRIGIEPAPAPTKQHIYIQREVSLNAGQKLKSFFERERIPFESKANLKSEKMLFVFDQSAIAQHAYKLNANTIAKIYAQPGFEATVAANKEHVKNALPSMEAERTRSRQAAKNKRDGIQRPTIAQDAQKVSKNPRTHTKNHMQKQQRKFARA